MSSGLMRLWSRGEGLDVPGCSRWAFEMVVVGSPEMRPFALARCLPHSLHVIDATLDAAVVKNASRSIQTRKGGTSQTALSANQRSWEDFDAGPAANGRRREVSRGAEMPRILDLILPQFTLSLCVTGRPPLSVGCSTTDFHSPERDPGGHLSVSSAMACVGGVCAVERASVGEHADGSHGIDAAASTSWSRLRAMQRNAAKPARDARRSKDMPSCPRSTTPDLFVVAKAGCVHNLGVVNAATVNRSL
ncbi:hypothetical protein DFP72DRAFT_1069307 [Ephemerocybe angulata]|uniref:Uncharacterized protein n=1 Tax=Ephemerocybe angulata TaxID=980116 RepID=A0A8H6M746_9AGAR|nr:hypothetical protein DFP72DRAFT_1069307 [Tulosesus angulatus]